MFYKRNQYILRVKLYRIGEEDKELYGNDYDEINTPSHCKICGD